MNPSTADSNFEKFRRERLQRRAQFGNSPVTAQKSNSVNDVEAYEQRQIHETMLTRDVHDFLAEATKHAATIVERVTQVAEAETAHKMAREMHEFLEETMRRAARFMDMVKSRRSGAVMQELEPMVSNLVGQSLDAFRHEGTAQLADKHIGQDPFHESLADGVDDAEADDDAATCDLDSEDHVEADIGADTQAEGVSPTPAADAAPARQATAASKRQDPDTMPTGAETEAAAGFLTERMFRDPETLKNALKALVKTGVLTQADARDTYRAALQRAQT